MAIKDTTPFSWPPHWKQNKALSLPHQTQWVLWVWQLELYFPEPTMILSVLAPFQLPFLVWGSEKNSWSIYNILRLWVRFLSTLAFIEYIFALSYYCNLGCYPQGDLSLLKRCWLGSVKCIVIYALGWRVFAIVLLLEKMVSWH